MGRRKGERAVRAVHPSRPERSLIKSVQQQELIVNVQLEAFKGVHCLAHFLEGQGLGDPPGADGEHTPRRCQNSVGTYRAECSFRLGHKGIRVKFTKRENKSRMRGERGTETRSAAPQRCSPTLEGGHGSSARDYSGASTWSVGRWGVRYGVRYGTNESPHRRPRHGTLTIISWARSTSISTTLGRSTDHRNTQRDGARSTCLGTSYLEGTHGT